jgi:[calcium/calmodulin-dependent protein kinase] kinase
VHSQSIIHRDLKPDNLLVSEDDVLKVVDFGVSEMFEKPEAMKITKAAGSPAFLPPELCGRHEGVSGTAADIWSMGVCLYCFRYGKIPFKRPGILEIYEAIKHDDPYLPEEEESAFTDLVTRLLDKNPETRITMPEIRVCALLLLRLFLFFLPLLLLTMLQKKGTPLGHERRPGQPSTKGRKLCKCY